MDRYFFIINPVAGTGKASKAFDLIESELKERNIDYDYAVSLYAGHTVELTKTALENGEKCIVSVGGDGTLREIAGAMAGSGATLGIVPCGTGNDFAKALGIRPNDASFALKTLLSGRPKRVDAGMANEEFFINVSGFGFDADVIANTEKFKKKLNGMLPYMMGIIQSLIKLRTLDLTITANGQTMSQKAIMIAVANGTHYGGGMNVAPFADPSDGMLDIYIVKAVSKLTFLALLPKFIRGKHTKLRQIIYFRASEVSVDCKQHSLINLDGSLGSNTPASFKILKDALEVMVPGEQ